MLLLRVELRCDGGGVLRADELLKIGVAQHRIQRRRDAKSGGGDGNKLLKRRRRRWRLRSRLQHEMGAALAAQSLSNPRESTRHNVRATLTKR